MIPVLALILTGVGVAGALNYRSLHDRYFFVNQVRRAYRLNSQGKRAEAIALLERLLTIRPYHPESARRNVCVGLAWLYHADKRYDDAVEQARAGLAYLREAPDPTREMECTWFLADSLGAMGYDEEAAYVRGHADALMQTSERDSTWHERRALSLEREGKHNEAAAEFILSLEKAIRQPPSVQAFAMLQVSYALLRAGRHAEGLAYAERAAETDRSPETQMVAHRTAASLACSLNRFDAAMKHIEASLAAARVLDSQRDTAMGLVLMAHTQFAQGKIKAALATIEKALATDSQSAIHARGVQYEAAMVLGQFEEAARVLESADVEREFADAHEKRRRRASLFHNLAIAYLALGKPEMARPLLEEARAEMMKDERLRLSWVATHWHAESLLRPDDAALKESLQEQIRDLSERMAEQGGDGGTAMREPISVLIRAATSLKDFETGLRLCTMHERAGPYPVSLPSLHYHFGECLRGLGRDDEARGHYQAAIATGIETYYTGLARERLAEK